MSLAVCGAGSRLASSESGATGQQVTREADAVYSALADLDQSLVTADMDRDLSMAWNDLERDMQSVVADLARDPDTIDIEGMRARLSSFRENFGNTPEMSSATGQWKRFVTAFDRLADGAERWAQR